MNLSIYRWPLVAFLLIALSGCATTYTPDSEARSATDVPDYFLVGAHDSQETAEPTSGEGCRNPMVDPRNGTRLTLVHSTGDRGDYDVPAGAYGVQKGQALRLECSTGRPVGIVQR